MFARTRLRAVAGVLIVLIFAGTNAPWHSGVDDLDRPQWSGPHDHRAHDEQLKPPVGATPSQHCVLCHWISAFRIGAQRAVRVAPPSVRSAVAAPASARVVPSKFPLTVPPRAPPACPA